VFRVNGDGGDGTLRGAKGLYFVVFRYATLVTHRPPLFRYTYNMQNHALMTIFTEVIHDIFVYFLVPKWREYENVGNSYISNNVISLVKYILFVW
jgi:hypothetical protein